jgi:hypothetical protein
MKLRKVQDVQDVAYLEDVCDDENGNDNVIVPVLNENDENDEVLRDGEVLQDDEADAMRRCLRGCPKPSTSLN